MGPALQVHTPPKKQRGAPCGAPRVFRPCVAQTEEGYIRRFYKREPRGDSTVEGGGLADLLISRQVWYGLQ